MKWRNLKLYDTAADGGGGGAPAPAPADAAPAAAEPTPTPTPAPAAEPPKEKSVAEILAYDPFAKPKEVKVDNTPKPAPVAPTPQKQAAPAQPPVAEAVPAKPQATPPVQSDEGDLKALLKQVLTERNAAPQAQPQQPGQQTKTAKEPRFNPQTLNIPPRVLEAIRSEEPSEAATGMNVLVAGVLNTAYEAFQRELEQTVIPRVQQMIAAHSTNTSSQQNIMQDFYGDFPQYNTEQLRPIVAMTAARIAQQQGFKTWSPQYKQAIAEAMAGLFASVSGGAQPRQTPAQDPHTPAQGAPRPPAQRGANGSRPVADNSVGADIRDTIFG